jgi:limonene 1,2-monooxygenase
MNTYPDMRFGAFIPPVHGTDENPILALRRDLDLIELMDNLDYDEAWIGEHHSTGIEVISAPELMIAAAAERTKYIRLGTGVNSLSYHHPFVLADRLVQLDYLTHGRLMMGVGPGQLVGDAYMMGIDPLQQRRMMGESLEVMLSLLRGETVTYETDWFKLRDARLQMLPYQRPSIEVATATALTPNGPTLAGRHGIGMLALTGGSAAGFAMLADHWRTCEEAAAKHGKAVDRRNWRIVASVHVAETRAQALKDVEHGVMTILDYYLKVSGEAGRKELNLRRFDSADEAVRAWVENEPDSPGLGPMGIGIIGTPEDVIERLHRYQERSGGFGCFLLFSHNAASWEATKHSLELFARKVVPAMRGTNRPRINSLEWSDRMSDEFTSLRHSSERRAREQHRARNP